MYEINLIYLFSTYIYFISMEINFKLKESSRSYGVNNFLDRKYVLKVDGTF